MARFLFCPAPEPGDTFPVVPVMRELESRGHQAVLLTDPALHSHLKSERLVTVATEGGVYGSEGAAAQESLAATFHRLPEQVTQLSVAFDSVDADVLVDGAFPFAARLLAEQRGLLHATIFSGCFPIPTNDSLFPHGAGHLPPTDQNGEDVARMVARITDINERDQLDSYNDVRAALGLPTCEVHPWRDLASQQLVLLSTSPRLEYPRTDLPRHYWFTGPLIWQPTFDLPERLLALGGDRTVVYASQGTTYNKNPILIRCALAAMADEPVELVATVCRPFEPYEFMPVPNNALLEEFIPLAQLADQLDAAVTHAGAGSVHALLRAGVPLVLMPFTADQFEVAARCVWAGVGVRLDPWNCTPQQLREAVQTVLGDQSYAERAALIHKQNVAETAPRIAADLLERLATEARPIQRPMDDDPWAI